MQASAKKGASSSSSSTPSASARLAQQQSLRRLSLCSQVATAQHSSPVVFPEKRSRAITSRRRNVDDSNKTKGDEHGIEIGDEHSDLLGSEVYSGKLALDRAKASKNNDLPTSTNISNQEAVDAKLTSKALIYGSNVLHLADVISVSYNVGLRLFTVHSYPLKKASCSFFCFRKRRRSWKDFRFLASSPEAAVQWVVGFADQHCFVNCLPHPLDSSKKHGSDVIFNEAPPELHLRCKSPPKMLVILNPRSGRGRSSKVFHELVEPIFKLAGFKMEVVKTASAGHARSLAYHTDFSTCPDGIICVGGDGIVNEVLNGLLSRDNQKEAISIPIGIIPAGSDNSLVWTVLGVRDPVSAALSIIKGGLTATDVFAVEWIQTGIIHFGMTVSYYGFVSDVLELSEKYQKRFGPLRYFVAGFLKFLCLPKYSFEVEYLPLSKEACEQDGKLLADREVVDMSDLYTDIMSRSRTDGLPRASSLSSIDSIMTPTRLSGGEWDVTSGGTNATTEPSEYVRAIDPRSKRLSTGRTDLMEETEVIHPQLPLSTTPNWPRTRSKSRTDKGWAGLTTINDTSRSSWGNAANDKEDISSTMSDPGPIWDAEPKWDVGHGYDTGNPIELPGPLTEDVETDTKKDDMPLHEDKWVVSKGQFLGILVCNHACKTVQSLSSQVVAPKAEHDDNSLDLLLVRGNGRLRLLRFFLLLQMGRHLSLPYVEYVKVKSVKIKPGKHTNSGCGIDGELLQMNGQVVSSLLPEQCRLIGRSHG